MREKMSKTYQENNLDIRGGLHWQMAPLHLMEAKPKPPFVITESGRFFARSKFFSRREGVDGYLFIYTQSGKGCLKYKGGEYKLYPGSIALLDCKQSHEYRTYDESSGGWTFYWLHCVSDNINFYEQVIYGNSFSLLETGEKTLHIFEDAIGRLPYSDPENLLKLHYCVDSLLALMINGSKAEDPADGKKTEKKEIIMNAAKYLKENYWMPFDMEKIADQFNLSKDYFARLFKEYTGMTPHNFVTNERISNSKILLQSTDEPVSRLCFMVGFRDESNFTRKFRELTGETPGTYRLKMQY